MKLHDKLDAVSRAMEVTSDRRARKELEQRLTAIQTSLNGVEASISKFENCIKECRMVEEEVHRIEEEASQDQSNSGDEATDVEMADQEDSGRLESSDPHREVNTKDNLCQPWVRTPHPLKKRRFSWVEHPNLRIAVPEARPPWSREGWPDYTSHPQPSLGLRRRRPHSRSPSFSNKS